ncbi:hypothetical protein J5J86_19005 [Aquabacter sp. L1I39]|uniref:hypothetical protein n=1 Tax=Aquabacter sp. L1I39 TaxID=2820278 RepID=UPI001ADB3B7A|nr:hypothetical protein [Aquabacter sp. L1I39]QTL02836.1 hypothetical protein J5J86_19005 [Aquabacter sp. L1I39]
MTTTSLSSDLPEEQATSPNEARAALARVLSSEEFVSSPRLADFLRYVVETTLAGRADEIKGYTIAVEALGRPTSFDPQSDPIVRVEATRLRRSLERYYSGAGTGDAIEIVIPKGAYVPLFRNRAARPDLPPEIALPLSPQELPAPQRRGRARLWPYLVGACALAVAGAVYLLSPTLESGPSSVTIAFGNRALSPADLADRMGMPILEVRPFELSGNPAPPSDDIHALEARMRDAFARFDFVDVVTPGSEAAAAECRGVPPRSVFSLGGLVEGHENGTQSLLFRLTDRCSGVIVWSTEMDGLKRSADLEQRVVRDVATAVMQFHGVLPTRARAQAKIDAPGSGFSCIAQTFAVIKGEDAAQKQGAHACIDRLVGHDNGYGVVHSLKAFLLLNDLRADVEHDPDPAVLAAIEAEAETGADLAPNSAFAARILAASAFARGDADEALASADKALTLNPLDYDTMASAGAILVGLGQPERGEAMLLAAREHGASRSATQDAYLAIGAFLTSDAKMANTVLPLIAAKPGLVSRIGQALALRTLGRTEEEEQVVAAMVRDAPGGFAGVRRAIHHLLPVPQTAARVIGEIEAAGHVQSDIPPSTSRG